MSSEKFPLTKFNPYPSSKIAYIRSLRPETSAYLFIGAMVLEAICMHCFAKNKTIFSKVYETLKKNASNAFSFYPKKHGNLDRFLEALDITFHPDGNFKNAHSWLMSWISNQESANIETVFKYISWIGVQKSRGKEFSFDFFSDILQYFAHTFELKIVLVSSKEGEKEFCNIEPGRYPICYILLDNDLKIYLGYPAEITKVEENLDQALNSDDMLFIVNPNIPLPSPSPRNSPIIPIQPFDTFPTIDYENTDNISKRTDISKLQLPHQTELELQCTYKHCIGIGRSYNQIRAFAVALMEFFKLKSNAEFTNQIKKRFFEKQTFTNLLLPKICQLSKKNIGKLVKELLEIYEAALKSSQPIDEEIEIEKEMYLAAGNEMAFTQIKDGLQGDFMMLKILGKLFGLTLVMIEQTHSGVNKYNKTQFNGKTLGFRPELHFIALKPLENEFHIHVLITNSHAFEDGFDPSTQQSLKLMQPTIEISQSIEIALPILKTLQEECLSKLINISNEALISIHSSLKNKTPIIVPDETLDSELFKLKNINNKHNFSESLQKFLNQPLLLLSDFSTLDFCQKCEYCSNISPNYFNGIGCYFHETCLEEIFLNWFKTCKIQPISEQYIGCPTCEKKIKLDLFLQTETGRKYMPHCLQWFEQKFICQFCSQKCEMSSITIHDNTCVSHACSSCRAFKALNGEKTYFCQCNHEILVPDKTELLGCPECGTYNQIKNFLMYTDNLLKDLTCKPCWVEYAYSQRSLNTNLKINDIADYFEKEAIFCIKCNQNEIQLYSNIVCPEDHIFGYPHKDSTTCPMCGTNLVAFEDFSQ